MLTCASRKSLLPELCLGLAWLGRGKKKPNIHSTLTTRRENIKIRIASLETSRRKKLLPTARPRCLVDPALHRSAEHASHWHSAPVTAPVSIRASSGTPFHMANRRPLHYTTAMLSTCSQRRHLHYTAAPLFACCQHHWGRPSDIHN